YYQIGLDKIWEVVFVNDPFKNFLFESGQIDFPALKRVFAFFCYREKIRRSLNDAPLGPKTEAVHEQSERRNHLGHAAAVIGRIEIRHPQIFELAGLLSNSLDPFAPNQRSVIFNLRDAVLRHFLNDSFAAGDTLASYASGD